MDKKIDKKKKRAQRLAKRNNLIIAMFNDLFAHDLTVKYKGRNIVVRMDYDRTIYAIADKFFLDEFTIKKIIKEGKTNETDNFTN